MVNDTTIRAGRWSRLRFAAAALPLLLLAAPASAQGLTAELGRFFDGDGWTAYRVAYNQPLLGPVGLQLNGSVLKGPGGLQRTLWGGGADLTLFQGGQPGLYAVGGVAGGIENGGPEDTWGSWSAGLGYEWLPLDFLSLGTEARWRELSLGRRAGVELSIRLGAHWGGSRPRPAPVPATLPLAVGGSAASDADAPAGSAAALRLAIIRTARAELGTRYQYGGTGKDGQGFDCSGLIQHAYAAHGIQLPRRSVDQAREGRPIERRLDQLQPGDLLTFSNRGGPVSHIGMYLGDGRFIHSASRGVQESRLSAEDPYGRWWWNRWVGVRRVVE